MVKKTQIPCASKKSMPPVEKLSNQIINLTEQEEKKEKNFVDVKVVTPADKRSANPLEKKKNYPEEKKIIPAKIPQKKRRVIPDEELIQIIKRNFAEFMDYEINNKPSNEGKLKAIHKETLDPYIEQDLICRGGFSEIYKCIDKNTNKTYAMKVVKTYKMTDVKIARLLMGEIEIMIDLKDSQFTILLEDYFVFNNELRLILELCNGGDLEDYVKNYFIKNNKGLPLEDLRLIAFNIASGLRDMHQKKIMHRDIKPKNILLVTDEENKKILNVKLCDYGLSRKILDKSGFKASTVLGTVDYFAPELYALMDQLLEGEEGGKYDNKVDIWSYGVLLYYAAFGKTVLKAPNTKAKVLKKGEIHFPESSGIPQEYKDLIKKCLTIDPKNRPTFDVLLKHPFFCRTVIPEKVPCPYDTGIQIGENPAYKSKVFMTQGEKVIKIVGLDETITEIDKNDLSLEVGIMTLMKSPYFVNLYDYFYSGSTLNLVMEYVEGENLEDYILSKGESLSYNQIMLVATSILKGLNLFHKEEIICARLSPRRVLLKTDKSRTEIIGAKLSDMGIAKVLLPVTSLKMATDPYIAPEIYYPKVYKASCASDVWSFGLILYLMLFGIPANKVEGNSIESILMNGTKKLIFPEGNQTINTELLQLIKVCLETSNKVRPTNAGQILEMALFHEYLNQSN